MLPGLGKFNCRHFSLLLRLNTAEDRAPRPSPCSTRSFCFRHPQPWRFRQEHGPRRLRALTMTLRGEWLQGRFCSGGPSLPQTCWHLLLHRGEGFYHRIKCQERLLAPDGPKPWWRSDFCKPQYQSDFFLQFSKQEFERLDMKQNMVLEVT